MKDLTFRFEFLKSALERLSIQFDVETPRLTVDNLKGLHGIYYCDRITLNLDTLHHNLAEALRTLRHEFYHYLEDFWDLPTKKSELKARRFERNLWTNKVLPKTQMKLFELRDAETQK